MAKKSKKSKKPDAQKREYTSTDTIAIEITKVLNERGDCGIQLLIDATGYNQTQIKRGVKALLKEPLVYISTESIKKTTVVHMLTPDEQANYWIQKAEQIKRAPQLKALRDGFHGRVEYLGGKFILRPEYHANSFDEAMEVREHFQAVFGDDD